MPDTRGKSGTHLVAPSHLFPNGQDLAGLPLEAVAGMPGLSIDASSMRGREIRPSIDQHLVRGRAVLIRTGWDELWGTERYWDPGPYIAEEPVDILVRGKPWLVGVDSASVDDTGDSSRPAHTRLLAEGILIVEHSTFATRSAAERWVPLLRGSSPHRRRRLLPGPDLRGA